MNVITFMEGWGPVNSLSGGNTSQCHWNSKIVLVKIIPNDLNDDL